MFDPEKFGQAMGEAIRKAVEPLHLEIADLKKKLAALPDHNAEIASQVAKAVAALPPGAAGKSITIEDVRPVLVDAVSTIRAEADAAIKESLELAESARDMLLKAVSELRQPEDGKSVTLADVEPLLAGAVQAMQEHAAKALDAAIQALPAPVHGKDGADGQDGARGADGVNGADGVGLAGAMIDRDGVLLVTLTNGEVKSLGGVVGKDGSDGVSFDSFEMHYLEEEHAIRVQASCAGRTKELRYPAGGLRPAGYWREGTKAKACETWVHDGSLWIATKDTTAKPETQADGWIIAARKGRDGQTIVKTANPGATLPIQLKG